MIHIDEEREGRQGFPEVVYGQGKSVTQLESICETYLARKLPLLITRMKPEHWERVRSIFKASKGWKLDDEEARCFAWRPATSPRPRRKGRVNCICAGSSDAAVILEAQRTLDFFGVESRLIADVGVAGIHRLLGQKKLLDKGDINIVAAGMDGALPSVVGGLVSAPVIAVPTSVGYGASFSGISALLAMLNSCASGLTVVNIDNGYGAAMAALRILNSFKQNSST